MKPEEVLTSPESQAAIENRADQLARYSRQMELISQYNNLETLAQGIRSTMDRSGFVASSIQPVVAVHSEDIEMDGAVHVFCRIEEATIKDHATFAVKWGVGFLKPVTETEDPIAQDVLGEKFYGTWVTSESISEYDTECLFSTGLPDRPNLASTKDRLKALETSLHTINRALGEPARHLKPS